jgi:hypothetical protein
LTSFAVENFLLRKEFDKSFGIPHWLVSFYCQKYQSVEFIHGRFASATKNSISIKLVNHFFHSHPFKNQMPTSYLASKPPPNPALPNWLTWMKADFLKISTKSSQVAALVGINRSLDLVILYKPIPVIATNGTLSAIIGNLNDKKSEPAFIKIDGMSIGSAYIVQNYDKIPAEIRPEIPFPIELLTNTVWVSAPKDIAICSYLVLAPVPFGTKIIQGHTLNKEFVENMAIVSPTHKAWVKLISDTIKQQETDDNNDTIYQKIISSKNT